MLPGTKVTNGMNEDLEVGRRRAKFRAQHRGTREMDWMLGRYAEATLAHMSAADLQLFEQLLTVPDTEIQAWLIEPTTYPQGEFQDLLAQIRAFHNL